MTPERTILTVTGQTRPGKSVTIEVYSVGDDVLYRVDVVSCNVAMAIKVRSLMVSPVAETWGDGAIVTMPASPAASPA